MTPAKELFQSKKELRNWWAQVVDHPNFQEVVLHTRSAFIENGLTQEQLAGAGEYERILTTLHEAGPADLPLPSPGLHHLIEELPPRPMPYEQPPPAITPKPQQKQKKGRK